MCTYSQLYEDMQNSKMFESLKNRRGSSNSSKMTLSFLIVHLASLSSGLVQHVTSESTIVSDKCEGPKSIGAIKCSNFTEIPTNLPNPETVRSLEMNQGNHIEILKSGSLKRSKLIALQYLKLQNCQVRVIEPGAFISGEQLFRIDLTSNMITTLNPDVFSDLMKLEQIILRKNPIKTIATGKAFPNLPKLSTLYLDYCQLDSIQTNVFDNLKGLKYLGLSGNHLKYLDWRMFRNMKNLNILSLQDNPWHCDCNIKFLMNTLKNLSQDTTGHLATCATATADKWARDMVGKTWNSVPEDKFMCMPKIDKFAYKSNSTPMPQNDNLAVKIGEDVFFECDFSGYPKPEITWYKDNQKIKESSTILLQSTIRPKIEFDDATSSILEHMEEDERRNNVNWKMRLIVHRVQARDRGIYECFVQHKHVFVHKTLKLSVSWPLPVDTDVKLHWIWMLVAIFCGVIILAMIFAVVVWKRRCIKEERGEIQDSSIDLENFDNETTCGTTQQFQYTRFT